LELWSPIDAKLRENRNDEVEKCRHQVMQSHIHRVRDDYLRSNQRLEDSLSNDERKQIFSQASEGYRSLLKNIGVLISDLTPAYFNQLLKMSPNEAFEVADDGLDDL
jgi:hypothetical protein